MAEVKLTNVKKMYDNRVVAVHDFTLTIKDREFIVIVGPSGCGKSTTMRMIAGLEEISDGTVEIDGVVVNDLEPRDRDVAMVFQNYALYPHLSVFENMAFALRIRKVPREEIFERVKNVAETLGITEYLARKPRALSGGQRQRVAIGRAMVRESKVFLLDEPLSNLDAKLRNAMRAELIALRKKIDSTFIYVTHDQTEAMTLGDRIVVMKDGKIQQVGTPSEVFDTPYNLFVAGFIGAPQMNFFSCDLTKTEEGKYVVDVFGVPMEVSNEKRDCLLANGVESRKVVLGVRPEHITLGKKGDTFCFPATVDISEMMGSEVHLHVTCPNQQSIIVRVATLTLSPKEKAALEPGNVIYLHFTGAAMHLFDPDTTRNLIVDPTIDIPVAYNEMGDNVTIAESAEESEKTHFQEQLDDLKQQQREEIQQATSTEEIKELKKVHASQIADLKAQQKEEHKERVIKDREKLAEEKEKAIAMEREIREKRALARAEKAGLISDAEHKEEEVKKERKNKKGEE
ncbi:MAG: sn-glycerol-3-phosphate ABC transporter ATP-binding protein UgpC [Coprobacillus sp.]|nr:sn-glycerol-3-phosphate ABC transporter ATP-binding protein UgpC [Coprobacillus sp.]